MSKSWKKLEDHVRAIASLRWSAPCNPEHVDGTDFDAVVHVSADEIVLIEITEERNINKTRDDINRLSPVRLRLATQGMICRCFIVMASEPTGNMVEAGSKSHINICSISEFERAFFDFPSYHALRSNLSFGSAIDSKTGRNDSREFIPIKYEDCNTGKQITIEKMVFRLISGEKLSLVGDFGTGKSRCVREIYFQLSEKIKDAGAFPLAINLREHWSSSNALELVAGHLGNIGLSSSIDNVMRLLNSGHLILLLDGFDEIGAQSYDSRIEDRRGLRLRAVQGVRDLISKTKAGVLVTGRSHFFDSDEEMLQSLGLSVTAHNVNILKVPEAFSEEEGQKYLDALGVKARIPPWLPRKPLVFQIMAELDQDEVSSILSRELGEYPFWSAFVYASCVRESRGVGETISPNTIHEILLELAAKTRYSPSFLGRLSPKDIDDAYEKAVGSAPDQTGRQLLSRMCTLGRIEPESPDRQFIDYDVVDILRAEQMMIEVSSMAQSNIEHQWTQTIRLLGVIYAANMVRFFDTHSICLSYLKKYGDIRNTKKLGEIVSILTVVNGSDLDFQFLQLIGTTIPIFDFCDKEIKNLGIKSSEINLLLIDNTKTKIKSGTTISDSYIYRASGISSASGLPDWFSGCEVMEFDAVSNSTRIKDSDLSPAYKLFLSIIHKTFFQAGSGREESSLLKAGFGQKYDSKIGESILKVLLKENILTKIQGDDGWIYKPVRKHTERMNKIKSELTLSNDPLWVEIGEIKV